MLRPQADFGGDLFENRSLGSAHPGSSEERKTDPDLHSETICAGRSNSRRGIALSAFGVTTEFVILSDAGIKLTRTGEARHLVASPNAALLVRPLIEAAQQFRQ